MERDASGDLLSVLCASSHAIKAHKVAVPLGAPTATPTVLRVLCGKKDFSGASDLRFEKAFSHDTAAIWEICGNSPVSCYYRAARR